MPRIRNRIALSMATLLITGLFIASLLSLQWLESWHMQELSNGLNRDSRLLSTQLPTADDRSTSAQWSNVLQSFATLSNRYAYVVDDSGNVLAAGSPSGSTSSSISWASPFQIPVATSQIGGSIGGERMLFSVTPLTGADHPAAVLVGVPLEPEYEQLFRQWRVLTQELAALSAVLLLTGYLIARRISSPLENIAETIEQISAGDWKRRVPYWGQDEYGKISTAVNSLTMKLLDQMDILSQEKSKVEGIIGHMGSGVLVVDRSGIILVTNQAALNILGTQYRDPVGRSHWEVTHSPELSERIDAVILKGTSQKVEVHIQRGASESHIELFATPIIGHAENVVGAVAVLHDVTQFRRVEKMRTEFVANVSHELKTPVTAVKGFAETLLDGALEDPELRYQFVQIIYNESDRLSRLVQDLLELSKIESGHSVFRFRPYDVNSVVEAAAESLRNQAVQNGLTLNVHLADEPAVAEVAPERIQQVLVNLIGNAIAYTPAPGSVDVYVANHSDGVEVSVVDTGIGIPEKDLPHIFERFYRVDKDRSRSTGGTGLGLAIVKHILEAHHSRIQVQSELGKGSKFSFVLPKSRPANAAEDRSG